MQDESWQAEVVHDKFATPREFRQTRTRPLVQEYAGKFPPRWPHQAIAAPHDLHTHPRTRVEDAVESQKILLKCFSAPQKWGKKRWRQQLVRHLNLHNLQVLYANRSLPTWTVIMLVVSGVIGANWDEDSEARYVLTTLLSDANLRRAKQEMPRSLSIEARVALLLRNYVPPETLVHLLKPLTIEQSIARAKISGILTYEEVGELLTRLTKYVVLQYDPGYPGY